MGWRDLLGGGDDKNKNKETPPAADNAPRKPRGYVTQIDEGSENYKEAIGLLQQLANDGLKKLAPTSDLQIAPSRMTDFAEYKISTGRGHVIQMRVNGRNEAKTLQNAVRGFLSLPDDDAQNPLKRQKRSEKRNGSETYLIFLNVGEHGLSADRAKLLLEGTLRRIGIEPDWKAHFVKSDRKEEAGFRASLRKQQEEAEERGKDDTPPGDKKGRHTI
ncbi:MAG: hypothetical protein LW823_08205 [Rickettsiales bacterium]|jgi:hypothetical protein|nr:hypothetical protein [Rickettsiales bacterium]